MAWLNASPDGSKKSRIALHKEMMGDDYSEEDILPDIGYAKYMIHHFYDAGVWTQTGMGGVALSWTDIKNWLECSELSLSYWELKTIRMMSCAYASEASYSSDKTRVAPFVVEEKVILSAEELSSKMAEMLRSLKRK